MLYVFTTPTLKNKTNLELPEQRWSNVRPLTRQTVSLHINMKSELQAVLLSFSSFLSVWAAVCGGKPVSVSVFNVCLRGSTGPISSSQTKTWRTPFPSITLWRWRLLITARDPTSSTCGPLTGGCTSSRHRESQTEPIQQHRGTVLTRSPSEIDFFNLRRRLSCMLCIYTRSAWCFFSLMHNA